MLKAIEHRGRDDEGVWTSEPVNDGQRVCLGHRRLSIIDTSNGSDIYQRLKFRVVGLLPKDGWSLTETELTDAICSLVRSDGE